MLLYRLAKSLWLLQFGHLMAETTETGHSHKESEPGLRTITQDLSRRHKGFYTLLSLSTVIPLSL
jgi:hypothetical protein